MNDKETLKEVLDFLVDLQKRYYDNLDRTKQRELNDLCSLIVDLYKER